MRLDQANRIMLGDREVSWVYLGANLVWQKFSPANLFAQGEQGVWYDPSDFSTLFQDSAGTTPVTAVGQPVGLMLDKSGNGNHAYQTTATSRPVLSARYNLLTKTEQFDDAAWSKTGLNAFGSGSVANSTATTDPLGGNTADFIQENTAAGSHFVNIAASSALLAATSYVFSAYVKAGGRTRAQLWLGIASPRIGVIVDLSAGTASAISAVGTGTTTATSISSVGNGWYRVSCTGTLGTAGNYASAIIIDKGSGHTYTGDGTSGIYIWGADLRVANDGANLPPYQRVNTATDYDTAGFPHYLYFDGVDDFLVTPTITPGTDKVQVFAGVRRLRSVNGEIIAETGASFTSIGAFYLSVAQANNRYEYAGRGNRGGSSNDQANINFFPPPDTAILTATQDINGKAPAQMRRNGGVWARSPNTTFGGGNFLAYPLYIGRRAGTSIPFNGHLYSLVLRFGSNLPIETIEQVEAWINTKTGAY